jgi:CheY-like chemotaxis protein
MARVLLVEDQPHTAVVLADVLRSVGHEATLAPTPDAALRLIQSDEPDVILLDFSLPGMTGPDFLRLPEIATSRAPIVTMSGLATEHEILECLRLGALDFVSKPVGSELLRHVVRYAEQRGRNSPARGRDASDRRRSLRPAVELPAVVVEYDGPTWQGHSIDLSTFGITLRPWPPPTGRIPLWAAKLHLTLLDGRTMLSQLSVLVRAQITDCVFRFVNLRDAEFVRFRDLVERLVA